MSNAKIEFIKSLYCDAKATSRETGMSWELILAQAAQETGWGEKILAGTHNIFNIKASEGWTGEKKKFKVWEIRKGKKVWEDADFRVYADYHAALRDRVIFLKSNPRYAKAGLFDPGTLGDLRGEASALQKAGYATDPTYAESLAKVFAGKTMQTAIKEAEAAGCDCSRGATVIRVTDAARAPLANQQIKIKTPSKEIIARTSANGELAVKPPASPMEVVIEVWNELLQKWFPSNQKISISSIAKSHTVISPYIAFKAATAPHVSAVRKTTATPTPPSSGATAYTIRRGDTLGAIAFQHGMRYQTLAEYNDIKPPYRIQAGATLQIPQSIQSGARADAKPVPVRYVAPTATHALPSETLSGHPATDVASTVHAAWLAFAEKERSLGIHRGGGATSDEHITSYAKATSMGSTTDTGYAYCAAFANWCLARAGYSGTNSAMAASFKTWGRATRGGKAAYGAIAVIKFPEGGHHVTFVIGKSGESRLITLGGNQGSNHAVSKSSVPASWVVALRYPKDYPDLDEDYKLNSNPEIISSMSYGSTH